MRQRRWGAPFRTLQHVLLPVNKAATQKHTLWDLQTNSGHTVDLGFDCTSEERTTAPTVPYPEISSLPQSPLPMTTSYRHGHVSGGHV
mmetsp:Transcript_84902/g.213980  ORF Transcript_84902/g.213980 Transcript_84902/m.213980 type:complete len:88 (+) Transcript_84902:78-341(+)